MYIVARFRRHSAFNAFHAFSVEARTDDYSINFCSLGIDTRIIVKISACLVKFIVATDSDEMILEMKVSRLLENKITGFSEL